VNRFVLWIVLLAYPSPSSLWAQVRAATPVVSGYVGGYWAQSTPLAGAYVLLAVGDDVRCRRAVVATRTDSVGRFTFSSVPLPLASPGSQSAAWAVCLPLPSDTLPSDTTRLRPTIFFSRDTRSVVDTIHLNCWAHMGTCNSPRPATVPRLNTETDRTRRLHSASSVSGACRRTSCCT
jgi:hypothetical protein